MGSNREKSNSATKVLEKFKFFVKYQKLISHFGRTKNIFAEYKLEGISTF